MKLGQQAFFYHSNCKEPGIVAIVKVSASFSFCVSALGKGNQWVIKQLTSPVYFSHPEGWKRKIIKAAEEPRVFGLRVLFTAQLTQQSTFPREMESNRCYPAVISEQFHTSKVLLHTQGIWLILDSLNSPKLSLQGSSIKLVYRTLKGGLVTNTVPTYPLFPCSMCSFHFALKRSDVVSTSILFCSASSQGM